ncbi:MAG: DNA polymerase III subunit delta' [Pseudomonadales bacterium]
MRENEFLPWHREQQTRVLDQHKAGKLPHAMLMGGPADVGKRQFAGALASYLLCQQPRDGGSCLECPMCHLVSAGSHPDLRWITPVDSKLIKIEQIRELIDWASQTAQMGGMKIAILTPAEQMNNQSANALLKCLEEPARNTALMLVSDQPGRLLPTIRSRCQRLDFPVPKAENTLAWLRSKIDSGEDPELLLGMAGGAPLAVVEHIDQEYLERRRTLMAAVQAMVKGHKPAGEVAGSVTSSEPSEVLEMLEGLFIDALKAQTTGSEKYIRNKDIMDIVNNVSEAFERHSLVEIIDRIGLERRAVQGPSNPNVQLLLEGVLIEMSNKRG